MKIGGYTEEQLELIGKKMVIYGSKLMEIEWQNLNEAEKIFYPIYSEICNYKEKLDIIEKDINKVVEKQFKTK